MKLTNRRHGSFAWITTALVMTGCVNNITGGVNIANGAKIGNGVKVGVNQGVQNGVNEDQQVPSDEPPAREGDGTVRPGPVIFPSPVLTVPTPFPNAIPSSPALQSTTIRGSVYDDKGALVSTGAMVTVRSLNPSNPFDSTIDAVNGNYQFHNVPAGVQLEVIATRAGWTTRKQVVTSLPLQADSNTCNFGGPGNGHFISDNPEIESIEHVDGGENANSSTLNVRVKLSESLNATNQNRFARALRVFPANDAAAPGAAGVGNFNTNPGAFGEYPASGNARGLYSIREGVNFLDANDHPAWVTWDAAGQTATFTFNSPMITSKEKNAEYQIALVSGGADEAVVDAIGNKLGGPYDVVGGLVKWAFKKRELGTSNSWDSTHEHAGVFSLAKDTTAPGLTSVAVTNIGADTRIALSFSDILGAFNDSRPELGVSLGAYNPSLPVITPQANNGVVSGGLSLTFVASDTSSGATGVTMDGVPDVGVDANAGTAPITKEFGIQGARLALSRDAKTLYVHVKNGFFPANIRVVRARVAKLADPAGNIITEMSADLNTKVGTF